MKYPLIAIAAIGAAMTATPLIAKEAVVAYGDLDLTTVEDQETLERRIYSAAREVCGYNDLSSGQRIPTPAMHRCLTKAQDVGSEQMAIVVGEERLGG